VAAILLQTTRTGFDSSANFQDKLDRSFAKAFVLHQLNCSRTLSNGPCSTPQYLDAKTFDGITFISSSGTGYPNSSSSMKLRMRCAGYELTPEYSNAQKTNAPLFGDGISMTCYPVRIFGIDDANNMWEINPIAKTSTMVFANALPAGMWTNAVAYDPKREQVLFIGSDLNLYCWSRVTNTVKLVGPISVPSQPFDADFYDNAFWFFTNDSNVLNKVNLTYDSAGLPMVSSMKSYNISGMNLPTAGTVGLNTNTFGDSAINHNTIILYASTSRGRFYKLDVRGDPTNTFSELKAGMNPAGGAGFQLSFGTEDDILYGHSFTTGDRYTVNLIDGSLTSIGFKTLPSGGVGFKDLGGAAWPKWSPN
jgi:hypothetical protein